jgi:hypothetical protein
MTFTGAMGGRTSGVLRLAGAVAHGASRLLEAAAVAAGIAWCARLTPVVIARAIVSTLVPAGRFVLGPLSTEAEPLKLGQIDFVQTFGRILVSGRVVHDLRSASGRS